MDIVYSWILFSKVYCSVKIFFSKGYCLVKDIFGFSKGKWRSAENGDKSSWIILELEKLANIRFKQIFETF